MTRVDEVLRALERLRSSGSSPGIALYVSLFGEPVIDVGLGSSGVGGDLGPHHLLRWEAMTRPMVAVALLQLVERGVLGLDDPISRHLPSWRNGKEPATLRHLLTHQAAFASCETSDIEGEEEELLERLCSHPAEHVPGVRAAYHRSGPGRIIDAVIRRATGQSLGNHLQESIWDPLGMDATYLGLDATDRERLGPWLAPVHWSGYTRTLPTPAGTRRERGLRIDRLRNSDAFVARGDPDLGAVGPAHDLGRFMEALIGYGPALFSHPSTRELALATHRSSLRDASFGGAHLPWGLGLMVAGGFAGSVGQRAVGHDGFPAGRAIADPAEGLVMVVIFTGWCDHREDARRLAELTARIYDAVSPRPRSGVVSGPVDELALRP